MCSAFVNLTLLAHLFILFSYFGLSFPKTYFIFSRFKSISHSNKQIMKARVEFPTRISSTWTHCFFKQRGPLIPQGCFQNMMETLFWQRKDWTWAFSKTFYLCCDIQDLISQFLRSVEDLTLVQCWNIEIEYVKMPIKMISHVGSFPIFNKVNLLWKSMHIKVPDH